MTIRREPPDDNPPVGIESDSGSETPHAGLLTLRSAVVLIASALVGVIAGVLTLLIPASPAVAILVGGSSFAGALNLLHALID